MDIIKKDFIQGFIQMAQDGWEQGWHERNGGNLSYRMTDHEVDSVRDRLRTDGEWKDIGTTVSGLAGDHFLVTGSGKFFSRIKAQPEDSLCILQVDETGSKYQVQWGLARGGSPTSELPTHFANHEVKKSVSSGSCRVIYHAHPANIIALTFVLPLSDIVFTRELWEMMPECAMVFKKGVGVLPWMVPGSTEIAEATMECMREYDVVIWAHHGLFAANEDFDQTFGLMHTVEKAAEILVKVLSMSQTKRQTTLPEHFRAMDEQLHLGLPEKFLYHK